MRCIIYTILGTLLLCSCDNSRLTIENKSDKVILYIISRTKEFEGKELVADRNSGDTVYTPRHGFLNGDEKVRVSSPFGNDQESWIWGINNYCHDSTLSVYFYPADDWVVPNAMRDIKWDEGKVLRFKVRDLDKINWTIEHY